MRRRFAPGLSGLKFFSLMPQFRSKPLETFMNISQQFGDVVCFRGLWTSLMLTHPSDVEYVLQSNHKNYRKGKAYTDVLKLTTGNGLIVSEGEQWISQRRMSQPTFHRSRIARFAETITDSTQAMLDQWQERFEQNQPVEVGQEMLRLILTIVGKTLFSVDLSDEANIYGQSYEIIRKYMVNRAYSLIKIPVWIPNRKNRQFRRAVGKTDQIVYQLIAERRRSESHHDDLLTMLIETRDEVTGTGMTDKQLRDEVASIIGAGYETTTRALTWTWYLLSKHPEVERQLQAEINGVLGQRIPTFDDLPQLKYTLWVFLEAMRLYPPVWCFMREAINDDEIGGFYVPKNAQILLFPYITHRHAQFWENPEVFDPQRFSPEQAEIRDRYAYFPFGGGPRHCIGENLATMEGQLILATVLQKYRLRLAEGCVVTPEPSVTLQPRSGVVMNLQKYVP